MGLIRWHGPSPLAFVTAGLVERQLNPADRRQRKIVATEHGLAVLADLERRVRHAEDHLLDELDDAERETFRSLLRRGGVLRA